MDLNRETLLKLYQTMATIRNFEELGIYEMGQRRYRDRCTHRAGQEAVPTGICSHLKDTDYIASTHRGHGHCIAKGVDPHDDGGAVRPVNRYHQGEGRSMHIADMSRGHAGDQRHSGRQHTLALGAALTSSTLGNGKVAVAFFGDGGATRGSPMKV